ncbi:kinesin-like protein KIF9 isoform X3 [Cephus cinctus]|uniref:Kinesin-like protein KIF9 isoform X3 n=1 Tax=Cephus cinctus TaxID=211228 RepID=A0AAJ7FCV2_CEPCN|nr:kinesin-like protein KIF9 isoform X3 [Cephus cinctus]
MTDNEEEGNTKIKNIKVFVRILPSVNTRESCVKIQPERNIIYVKCLQDAKFHKDSKVKDQTYWRFPTDGIFYNSFQEDVYQGVTKDFLKNVLDGVDGVIMTYGQTATGKSFTISGLRSNWENRGLLARLLADLFIEKKCRKHISDIEYQLSFIELRGNNVKDLLTPQNGNTSHTPKLDSFKNITSVPLRNEEDTLKIIFEGEAHRTIIKGSSYPNSHLGTAIITFHISSTSLIKSWAVVTASKIHIVDMAGVDTIGKPNCFKTAFDVGNANLAKTQLEQFFVYLGTSENISTTAVVRTSNVLKYLGNALGVTSIIRCIAHIRASREDLDITLSMLRFSNKIAKLQPLKVTYNIVPQASLIIQRLQDKVNLLKNELDINDIFFHKEALMNMSKARVEQIKQDGINFLNGTLPDLMLLSISQAQVLLRAFKELYTKTNLEKIEAVKNAEMLAASKKDSTQHLDISSSLRISKSNKFRRDIERLHSKKSAASMEKVKEKVGDLRKSSITLGPGLPDSAEGDAIKAMKITRHTKLSDGLAYPDSAIADEINSLVSEVSCRLCILIFIKNITVPTHEEAYYRFINKIEEAARLNKELQKNDEYLDAQRKTLTEAIESYTQIKLKLELTRNELTKEQNLRHLQGNEKYDTEGRILISQMEKNILQTVMNLENNLKSAQAEFIDVKSNIKNILNNRSEIQHQLETAFEKFCVTTYSQPIPKTNTTPQTLESEINENNSSECMKIKFNQLQQTMKHIIKVYIYQFTVLIKDTFRYRLFIAK